MWHGLPLRSEPQPATSSVESGRRQLATLDGGSGGTTRICRMHEPEPFFCAFFALFAPSRSLGFLVAAERSEAAPGNRRRADPFTTTLDRTPIGSYIVIMRVKLIPIGNSKGVRLPKALIRQYGLSEELELEAGKDGLILRAAQVARAGWDEAFAKMRARQEDELLDSLTVHVPTKWEETGWRW